MARVVVVWVVALLMAGTARADEGAAQVFVQLGHRSAIAAVAVSPDGTRAASASADGSIRLWDLRSSREIRALGGHQGGVLAAAFSPDGKLLASGGRDRTVRIWDVTSGQALRILNGHENIVLAVAFAPGGREVYSADYDGSLRAWKVADGAAILDDAQEGGAIRALAFSRTGRYFALALDSGDLKIFHYPGLAEAATVHGHQGAVLALAFDPQDRLASVGQDGAVRIREAATGRELQTLEGGRQPLSGVSYSADGRWLAAAGRDGIVRVWQAADGMPVRELKGHAGDVQSLAFARGGMLVSGGQDRGLHVWDVAEGKESNVLRNRASEVRAIVRSLAGKRMAVAGVDGAVRIWDTASGKVLRTLGGREPVEALAFSADGQLLAAAVQDGAVRLWSVAQGELLHELKGHRGAVLALAFAPDGRQLASAGRDMGIRLWDVDSGVLLRELNGHRMSVRGLAYSPDGRQLASASYDDSVRLWRAADGSPARTYEGHANRPAALAFTADGAWLVTGGEDSLLRMLPLTGGAQPRVLEGHAAAIRAIAVEGQDIVSASVDGTVAVWDAASGKRRASYAVGAGQLLAADVSGEAGGAIWTGGDGGATVVLSLDGKERARLYGFADGGWAAITPQGFFNASDSGAAYLNVRLDGEVYGLEQFTESFFRPDAVRMALLATDARQEEAGRLAAQRAEAERAERLRREQERTAMEKAEQERIAHEQAERALADARKKEEAARQEQETLRQREELARMERERTEAERIARAKAEQERAALERAEQERIAQEQARLDRERVAVMPSIPAPPAAPAAVLRPQRLAEVRPAPSVEIVGAPAETSEAELLVTLRVSDAGGGIGDIRLYLNGTAVLLDATRNLAVAQAQPEPGVFRYRVRLVNGDNLLRAIAFNADNSMQSADAVQKISARFEVARRPVLRALVVGIQEYRNARLNLQYSVADARMFADILDRNSAGLFASADIRLLTAPQETTRSAVVEALREMKERVNPEDMFVFYVASHATVEEGNYLLITSNVGSTSAERLRQDAIGQSLLKELVANIPATKKFIVLDTCNAGQLGEAMQLAFLTRGMNEDTATKILSRAVGSTVLSAATSQQEAVEGYNGHGLFTWVVAEGLRGEADADRDGFVKTTELAEYVDSSVPELAEQVYKREQFPIVSPSGMQFPLTRVSH